MVMSDIATIRFSDAESGEDAVAIVRVGGKKQIALCLSLEENGDVEVFLRVEDCENLVKALEQAISVTEDQGA